VGTERISFPRHPPRPLEDGNGCGHTKAQLGRLLHRQELQAHLTLGVHLVMFLPEVTIIEQQPILPTAGIGQVEHEKPDKSQYTMKQWTDYRKSIAPIDSTPDEADEYISQTAEFALNPEDYGPEPAYANDQEQEIACLVSAYNESYLNDDPAAPKETDDVRTGCIRVM
jgi:hypothetical protein